MGEELVVASAEATPKAERQARFLTFLADYGIVLVAARDAGISRGLIYKWRGEDPEFAKKWDEAVDLSSQALEAEVRRRAFHGVDEPKFHNGEQCGVVRKYSDTLAMFLLKAHKPERFRERTEQRITGTGVNGAVALQDVTEMSSIEKASRLAGIFEKALRTQSEASEGHKPTVTTDDEYVDPLA